MFLDRLNYLLWIKNAESWDDADLIAVKRDGRMPTAVERRHPARRHSVHRGILREDLLSPKQRMSPGSSPWRRSDGLHKHGRGVRQRLRQHT